MEIDPLWAIGGWITFSSSSCYSSTCMAKPPSPSLSPAASHQKTLPIYHQLTKTTTTTTTTTLKTSIFFISSLFFLLILAVARPSPHDQVAAVVAVEAAAEVELPESSAPLVRTLGTKTFTTVAAVGRTLKSSSSESSSPATGTAARGSKAAAVKRTEFGPGKGHKHGLTTYNSENEFKAAAHEVPSGPNPISN